MLERMQSGYRQRFRALLAQVRPKRLEFGVRLLMRRARERSEHDGVPLPAALAELYEATRRRVEKRVRLTRGCALNPFPKEPPPAEPRFLCDGSLGGLAHWLRAAGYEARELGRVRGDALVHVARHEGGTLLTTDSRLWERRAILDGTVPALWIPTGMEPAEQLAMVLRDLALPLREPRCMACGGALAAVAKDSVRERIPPRTARWKDEYFVCEGCGQLFWQGTHWERIEARLRSLGLCEVDAARG